MNKLNQTEATLLNNISVNLGVPADKLYQLIDFESGWNPTAKNPRSSARGLIQFTDSTSRSLGYKNSSDLVKQLPTRISQLKNAVYPYLMKFKPYRSDQALFMAVFYPASIDWHPYTVFPESVRSANPGINTPADFINAVYGKKNTLRNIVPIVFLLAMYIFLKGKNLYESKKEN